MKNRLFAKSFAARSAVSAFALLSASLGQHALAQETEENFEEESEAIVVLGSRAPDRTVATSPVPVDVFDGDDLAAQGALDLATALRQIAPSLNFNPDTFGGTAVPGRPATLRGLGPDQVLVLINGKRRQANSIINTNNVIGRGSAAVDLNLIPLAAVKRLEVLRDGAAAQYGSDAIAGVINIVLKDQSDGGLIALQTGITDEGDGDYGQLSGNVGLPLMNGGFLNLSADVKISKPTNRAILDLAGDPSTNPNFGTKTAQFGSPRLNLFSFSANAGVPISDNIDLEAFATFASQDIKSANFFRGPFSLLFPPEDGGVQFPSGYLPQPQADLIDGQISVALVGNSSEWNWEVGTTYGINDLDPRLINTIDPDLAPNSPTDFELAGFTYEQITAEATADRYLDVLGGVTVTLGAGYRHEGYKINALDPGVPTVGGVGFLGAVDETRDSFNLFTELNVNLADSLTVDLAARYEDYSDFGDELIGKVSALFQPTDFLGIRGSASTGFRAPSLQQQFFNDVSSRTTATGGGVQQGLFPVGNPAAIAVGASPLEAEKSVQFSAGATLTIGDLFITFDYFNTDIDDRIVLSESLAGAAVDTALAAQGVTGVGAIQFFTNAVDTTTEGFEIVATYSPMLSWDADLDITLGYVNFDTSIDSIRDNPATPGVSLFNTRSQIFLTRGQPDERGTANISYNQGRFAIDMGANYYGSYETLFGIVFKFEEEFTFDLAAAYDLTDSMNLRLGAKNIGNQYPDRFQDTASGGLLAAINSLGIQYPVEAPFGLRGREYYARLEFTF